MLTTKNLAIFACAISFVVGQGTFFSGFGNENVNPYSSQSNPNFGSSYGNPYAGNPYAGNPYAGNPYAGNPYAENQYAGIGSQAIPDLGFQYGYNTVTPPPVSRNQHYGSSLLNAYASSVKGNSKRLNQNLFGAYRSPISNLVNAYKNLYSSGNANGMGFTDFPDQDFSTPLQGAKSYGHFSSQGQKRPQKVFVPVVVHKQKKKKQKIITVMRGMFIAGGTQMFGKFKDLFSCKKACAITSTCFAGDFDPWTGKCFMHSNITACQTPSTHPAITHFKKVPCDLVSTSRGLITLGTQLFGGLEQSGAKDLKSCLKKCISAGGGIAATTATISTTPQICFGIDYDFGNHKCYLHTDSGLCPAAVVTPINLFGRPSSVNILLCPLAA